MSEMPTSSGGRVWIKDGVIYTEFNGEFALDTIFSLEAEALNLIKDNQITHIPNVVLLGNVTDDNIKLNIAGFAKIFTSFELVKHISAIIVVQPSQRAKQVLSTISRVFMGNRMQFANSLEEARPLAQASRSLTLGIMEGRQE